MISNYWWTSIREKYTFHNKWPVSLGPSASYDPWVLLQFWKWITLLNSYAPLVHVYNSTRHDTTDFSPYYILFGREPRLPIDLILPRHETTSKTSYSGYIAALRKRMKYAHGVVEDRIKRKGETRKEWYNKKVRGATLIPGDQVLLRRLGLQGKNKLADRWEEEVFVVTSQPNTSIPVFTIRQLDGNGRSRTVHRNLLLPVKSVPSPAEHNPAPTVSHTPRVTRSRARQRVASAHHSSSVDGETDSDHSGCTVSTMVPQHPTSLLACKADSSLDLDEDEASMLLEESLIRSDNDDTRDGLLDGGGHEADVSDLEVDPGHESTDQEQQSSVQSSCSGVRDGPSGSEVVRPRRIIRRRQEPAWMRTGVWDLG